MKLKTDFINFNTIMLDEKKTDEINNYILSMIIKNRIK